MRHVTDVYLQNNGAYANVVYKVVTVGAKRERYSSQQVAASLHWSVYQKVERNSPRLDTIANRSMLLGRKLTSEEAMEILRPDFLAEALTR
jgi:hypothetical protein